ATTGVRVQAKRSSRSASWASKTGSAGSTWVAMKSFSSATRASVRESNEKSMSVLSLRGTQARGEQWFDGLTDVLESAADGLSGTEAVVDPLEDRGQLVVGQAQVELHGTRQCVGVQAA